jgi:hypothetical protein
MIAKRIVGTTRTIGKSQGYLGLSIRDQLIDCPVNGPDTPCMLTAWEPTPDELERLNQGKHIILRILGNQHPAVYLEVSE